MVELGKVIKKLTPDEKIKASLSLYYSARELRKAGIRKKYPNLNEKDVEDIVKKEFLNART